MHFYNCNMYFILIFTQLIQRLDKLFFMLIFPHEKHKSPWRYANKSLTYLGTGHQGEAPCLPGPDPAAQAAWSDGLRTDAVIPSGNWRQSPRDLWNLSWGSDHLQLENSTGTFHLWSTATSKEPEDSSQKWSYSNQGLSSTGRGVYELSSTRTEATTQSQAGNQKNQASSTLRRGGWTSTSTPTFVAALSWRLECGLRRQMLT